MLFKHRTVGPRKGNGAILIGKINPPRKKTRQQKIADRAMRTYAADTMTVTLGDSLRHAKD